MTIVVVANITGIAVAVVVPVCSIGCAGIVPDGVDAGGLCAGVVMLNLFSSPEGITPDFPAPMVISSLSFCLVFGPIVPSDSMPCFS